MEIITMTMRKLGPLLPIGPSLSSQFSIHIINHTTTTIRQTAAFFGLFSMFVNMNILLVKCLLLSSATFYISEAVFSDWNYWPSTGRGPESWGYFSGAQQCRVGRRQSPIDIDPGKLLFDPSLRTPLKITQQDLQVPLNIVNTGIDVTIKASTPPTNNQEAAQIKITGGPYVNKINLTFFF